MLAVQIMNEILPAGVLNIVTSDDQGTNIGAAMAAHPDIRKIVFTGSATGEKVMQSAAATMKRLTLELGGNESSLPDPGDCRGLYWGAFINTGQTWCCDEADVCASCMTRLPRNWWRLPRTMRMGNGLEDGVVMGPLTTPFQHEKEPFQCHATVKT